MEYQIAEDINGNRFYFAKDITNNTDLLPANRNQNPAPKTSPINSITDNNTNFNPNTNLYDKFVFVGFHPTYKLHLYNFYDKKFSPILNDNTSVKLGENSINSITDNNTNFNPNTNLYDKFVFVGFHPTYKL